MMFVVWKPGAWKTGIWKLGTWLVSGAEPPPDPEPAPFSGNSYVVGSGHRPFRRPPAIIAPREEDEALLMTGLI